MSTSIGVRALSEPWNMEAPTTKSDRQLLELAGKAAKLDLDWTRYDEDYGIAFRGLAKFWNPLRDGNDALDLAVLLNLDILQDPCNSRSNGVEVIANEPEDAQSRVWAWEVRAPDPAAATRRAIVRCAAHMGELMG